MINALWAVLGVHAGVLLVPSIPRTLGRLVQALRPNGAGIADDSLFAVTANDVRIRPWYTKIARDLKERGRNGFAWDDGFGAPMGVRFYNNLVTYTLYRRLGARGYVTCCLLLFAVGVVVPAALQGEVLLGVALTLLALGSPLFLVSQLHLGKPELLWWGFMPPMLYAAWTGHWLAAGLIFSVVAIGNFAAASLFGVTTVLLVVIFWPGLHDAAFMVMGMAIGLLKTALRLLPFVRAGLLGSLAREQADAVQPTKEGWVAKLRLLADPGVVFYGAFYFAAVILLVRLSAHPMQSAAFAFAIWAVYFAGQKLFYLNDPQSFWLWHLGMFAAMAIMTQSWSSVFALFIFAYMHPGYVAMPVAPAAGAEVGSWQRWVAQGRDWRRVLHDYPYIELVSREDILQPLKSFFANVPDGARVLFESRSHVRDLGGYRTFIQICDEVLPERKVELLPDEYVRIYSMHFQQKVLARFNSASTPDEVLQIADLVGASYALASSAEFEQTLINAGFQTVGRLSSSHLSARTRRLLQLPDGVLVLLVAPMASAPIAPATQRAFAHDEMHWAASRGETYTVRYMYAPGFRAIQGNNLLDVKPVPVADASDLRFMQILAPADGPVRLQYRGAWI